MPRPRVTLFIQCLVDTIFPHAGMAMVRVFDRLGIAHTFPEGQTCCGQPAFNSGYRREATEAARHFLATFADAEAIVCPSGSCVAMIRHHYPALFLGDPPRAALAKSIAARTFEFTEYLVDILGVVDVGAVYAETVTYHDSCHLLRHLGIARQPRALLSKVAGLTLAEMPGSDSCCGFGGTFSINYPAISTAMADEKIDNILQSGATTVVGCDASCLMQLQSRMTRRGETVKVCHIAEILAEDGDNVW